MGEFLLALHSEYSVLLCHQGIGCTKHISFAESFMTWDADQSKLKYMRHLRLRNAINLLEKINKIHNNLFIFTKLTNAAAGRCLPPQ